MDVLDILADKKVLYAEDEKGIRKHITEVLELFLIRLSQSKMDLRLLMRWMWPVMMF